MHRGDGCPEIVIHIIPSKESNKEKLRSYRRFKPIINWNSINIKNAAENVNPCILDK